jgi:hypothetical protein
MPNRSFSPRQPRPVKKAGCPGRKGRKEVVDPPQD